MFRRIEVIGSRHIYATPDPNIHEIAVVSWKAGINSMGDELNKLGLKVLACPELNKPIRFYFTEKGWKRVGRSMLSILKNQQIVHRVISVKENSVDVVAGDGLQVAVRPRKRKRVNKNSRCHG